MTQIIVEITINKNIETVWQHWTDPDSIVVWNHASSDWYCPKAINNLKIGGTFSYIMSSKDKSISFDFSGTYTKIIPHKLIEYNLGSRKVRIVFENLNNNTTKISETFEAESINTLEKQKEGWFAILNNFKLFCEKVKLS